MPSIEETINSIQSASSWDERVAQIRLIPQNHGTGDHPSIYAHIAKLLYVSHLAPDFAYVHEATFYDGEYFAQVYSAAHVGTDGFANVAESNLRRVIDDDPRTLLIFRTILGLTKDEFSHSTKIVGTASDLVSLSASKVDSLEKKRGSISSEEAAVAAKTISYIMERRLFGAPSGGWRVKQDKPDTCEGWESVRGFERSGVPYSIFLHQRHYGGAFRQIIDATSTKRGNILEDAVEKLFISKRISFVRTGSNDQSEIERRFGILVRPTPDFVVFDSSDQLRAMLECKTINDGGTARDKAPRFKSLRDEAIRLGGIPLIAILGGMGWARVNDALGPVVRDTEGRVFTLSNLSDMLEVAPFPSLNRIQP